MNTSTIGNELTNQHVHVIATTDNTIVGGYGTYNYCQVKTYTKDEVIAMLMTLPTSSSKGCTDTCLDRASVDGYNVHVSELRKWKDNLIKNL